MNFRSSKVFSWPSNSVRLMNTYWWFAFRSGARPSGARPSGARPSGTRPSGARPSGARPSGARPSGTRPFAKAHCRSRNQCGESFENPGAHYVSFHIVILCVQILNAAETNFSLPLGTFPSWEIRFSFCIKNNCCSDCCVKITHPISACAKTQMSLVCAITLSIILSRVGSLNIVNYIEPCVGSLNIVNYIEPCVGSLNIVNYIEPCVGSLKIVNNNYCAAGIAQYN